MKVAVVFILLFATVLCRPARKVAVSSESSEEVGRRPAAPALGTQAEVPQNVVAAAGSDESTDSSDEDQAPVGAKSASTDTTSSPTTDSEDSDDDDDDSDENETEENDSSDSSESGEASTAAPGTVTPAMVTEEPMAETTPDPIEPTIVTDTDARGDSLGGYPSDYKSIVYVEDKSYHKVPAPYKSYEYVGMGKKMAYDMTEDNEVDKSPKVYKALQVHSDILEEDTSTPEVESQSLDAGQDQDPSPRQVALPEEESNSDATTSESESSSAPEEDEEQESASTASASQESEDEDSQSSEEATATPGAADSDSDESTGSDSDEQGAGPDTTTDIPVVITAK